MPGDYLTNQEIEPPEPTRERLLSQECLLALDNDEKHWVTYFYDHSPKAIKDLLERIYFVPEKDKPALVSEGEESLAHSLGLLIEHEIGIFLEVVFSDDEKTRAELTELMRYPDGFSAVSRAAWQFKENRDLFYQEGKRELTAQLFAQQELEKVTRVMAANLEFELEVASLPADRFFAGGDDEIVKLRGFISKMGKDWQSQVILIIKKLALQTRDKAKMLERLKRALELERWKGKK